MVSTILQSLSDFSRGCAQTPGAQTDESVCGLRSTFKGQAAFLSPHNERAYFPPYAGNEGLYTH